MNVPEPGKGRRSSSEEIVIVEDDVYLLIWVVVVIDPGSNLEFELGIVTENKSTITPTLYNFLSFLNFNRFHITTKICYKNHKEVLIHLSLVFLEYLSNLADISSRQY
jgi:hypothetical protein